MTRTLTLTTDAFRDQHGDPATWSSATLDSYLVIGEIAPPPPLRYTHRQMQRMSVSYARSAAAKDELADQLAAEGYDIAAGTLRRGAREAREHAEAAGLGWPHYEAFLNGW
ncbi:hypothetical protein [Streptomyces griseus]|uniref:hypothetical protein n=1 Tax=Streptomyces griseus TaxID=1911 RepID=UPI003793EF8C